MPKVERFRICEVPNGAHFFHRIVSLMPSRHTRVLLLPMLHDCYAAMAAKWEQRGRIGLLLRHDTAG
jgi:hypothetical protein